MILKRILQFGIFILLTIITQIGGIVYLLSLWIHKKWKLRFKFKSTVIFIGLYLISTFIIVPLIAPLFGREKVIHSEKIKPTNFMTVLFNRNYVKPDMNNLLRNVEKELSKTPIIIQYLDANFPFFDGFPLLPHLSHNEGKKLDIGFVYEHKNSKISNKQKSISGYGFFENPKKSEVNQIRKCLNAGYFQYDFTKYMTFGTINSELVFSEKGTKKLIESILKQQTLEKLFIEPHLKTRLNLKNNKVRFHGCKAVRHDDHIHIQIQ